MIISEAIQMLQHYLAMHGDLEIVGVVEVDGQFAIDEGRIFDVIGLPEANEERKVCAFITPIEEDDIELDSRRPRLKAIK